MCVPKQCSQDDMKLMLETDAKVTGTKIPERVLQVVKVRLVPGPYPLWADKKLHLLW